jgi:PAS domain S-box-containing protein
MRSVDTPKKEHHRRPDIPNPGIVIIDNTAIIQSCNTVFAKISGSSKKKLIGSNFIDLLADEFPGKQQLRQHLDTFADASGTLSLRKRGGLTARFSYSCLPLPHGENPLRLLALSDIKIAENLRQSLEDSRRQLEKTIAGQDKKLHEYTSSLIETNVDLRKKIRQHQLAAELLKESETRFRDLTETTSDFIWEIDSDGRYTYASPKISKLLGYQPEELLGERFLLLRSPELASRFIREIELGLELEKGFCNWHYSCLHKDGREIIIESSGEPIILKKKEIVGYRGIDRDITERTNYENNLRRAKELAESANRAKSEFLANMSHELRTPLHAILSFSKYGEKKINTAATEDLLKYFQQIETSAKRLLPLINSLLDLSKLEAGKMNYDIVHGQILPEIEAAVDEIGPLAAQKNVQIVIDREQTATKVYFDRNRLAHVVRNLLSNAVKFCSPHSCIVVSFALVPGNNNKSVFRTTVANTGVGIPENELETIFDKFAQSSKTKTGAGGTGLGLAICRQILLDLRGRIWAENGENDRTLFHFTLPTSPKSERIGQILINKGLVSREDLEKALLDQE